MVKCIFIILLFSITISACFSQTDEKLEINKTYSLAKFYKKDYSVIKGIDFILINDSTIRFRNTKTHITEYLSVSDLNRLRVKSGNNLLPYALGGAVIGLTFDLLFVTDIATQEPSEYELKVDDVPAYIYVGTVALGAAIGAIIGIATPKWKTLSIPKQKLGVSIVNIYPIVDFSTNHYFIGFNINF